MKVKVKKLKIIRDKFTLVDPGVSLPVNSHLVMGNHGYAILELRKYGRIDGVRVTWRAHLPLHRWLLKAPDHLTVDHKNRNRLDNRRCNIRLATRGQNQCNRGPQGKVLYKGVQYKGLARCKHRKKAGYTVTIRVNGQAYNCGTYTSPEVAARVYDREALKLHGEFAHLNFPTEDNSKYQPPKSEIRIRRAASGYTGVYFCEKRNRFYIQVRLNGMTKTVGTSYKTPKEGHEARLSFLERSLVV